MLLSLFSVLAATPFPFPQDCSRVHSASAPTWFTNCDTAAGGCFIVEVPKLDAYNVGNTTFGATPGGGVKWCIDHLQACSTPGVPPFVYH